MGLSGDGQLAVDASPAFGSLATEAAIPFGTTHSEEENGHSLPGLQSEMGSLIRSLDWATTPLGPVHSWSQSLCMAVSFLLANRFPLLLWWGPQYISIYNDAYRPILGTKHPRALGQPVSEVWSEIWQVLKPLIDTPFAGGPVSSNSP
jgi:hypothetical protein